MIEYVGIDQAAHLLGICRQRVQQLLYEGRIEGAFKEGRFWKIPLYNEMPQIIPGTRGPEGTWHELPPKTKTYIQVEIMESITLRSRVSADGILRLELPVELANQELNLVLAYHTVKEEREDGTTETLKEPVLLGLTESDLITLVEALLNPPVSSQQAKANGQWRQKITNKRKPDRE